MVERKIDVILAKSLSHAHWVPRLFRNVEKQGGFSQECPNPKIFGLRRAPQQDFSCFIAFLALVARHRENFWKFTLLNTIFHKEITVFQAKIPKMSLPAEASRARLRCRKTRGIFVRNSCGTVVGIRSAPTVINKVILNTSTEIVAASLD